MEIEYKNYVASGYEMCKNSDGTVYFRSTDTFSPKWEKPITLTVDDSLLHKKDFHPDIHHIGTLLANARTEKDALKFTKKYGALVNIKLFRSKFPNNHSLDLVLSAIEDDYADTLTQNASAKYEYDYMLYDHFAFYQWELYHLIRVYNMLSETRKTRPSAQFMSDLFNETLTLLINPYFEAYIYLEYLYPTQEEIVDDSFPFTKLRYSILIDENASFLKHFKSFSLIGKNPLDIWKDCLA